MILDAVEIGLLAIVYIMVGYLLLLTVLAGRALRRKLPSPTTLRTFAIVIPAHDEESGIERTIRSLQQVDYPSGRYQVVVIADNCSDATAARATTAGAVVWQRTDDKQRGKGYALRWGFDRLLHGGRQFDALVVIDADSVVSPNFLAVMNGYLEHGATVIQSSDLVSPDADSWSAQMTRIGFLLYNYVRPLGRTVIGGTAGLRGNGMCFATPVLRKIPWDSYSITEDSEFGLRLLLQGVPAAFAHEAQVHATMPNDSKNARSQRARWEGGRYEIVRRFAPKLLAGAIRRGSIACLDALFDLAFPALVNFTALLLGAFLLSLIRCLLTEMGSILFPVLWLAAIAMVFVHLGAGLRLAGADGSLYRALFQLPRYVLWKLSVYLEMPGRWRKDVWTRTTREP